MEFAFKCGIRDSILKHNFWLQFWHVNCLNFLYIRLVKNHTQLKYFVIYILKGLRRTVSMHFPIQPVRRTPFQKHKSQKIAAKYHM